MEYSCIECLQPYHCSYCDRNWDVFSHYQLHMRRHKVRTKILARTAWRRSYTGTDSSARGRLDAFIAEFLKSHSFVDVVDGRKRYRCDICNKICQNAGSFKNHNKVHVEYNWFQTIHMTSRCGFSVQPEEYQQRSCKVRIRKSSAVGKKSSKCHICLYCGRDLHVAHSLYRHISLHMARGTLTECLYCNVKFNHTKELTRHVHCFHGLHAEENQNDAKKKRAKKQSGRSGHAIGNRKFKCKICGKQTRDNTDLKRHNSRNHSEPLYKCNICGKQTNNLKRHKARNHSSENDSQVTHTNGTRAIKLEKSTDLQPSSSEQNECTQCGDKFTNKSELLRHALIHTDERPYQCRHCELRYKRAGDRNRHERSHTGVHLMTCKFCGRGSRDMNTLMKHERTHTKEKALHRKQ